MPNAEERLNELFDELVPNTGKASTVAGEIVRAIARIGYRYYNDGDHIGVGYGNHTCNAAARYLKSAANGKIADVIDRMWGLRDDDEYGELLGDLEQAVLDYLDENAGLQLALNDTDMLDFHIPEDEEPGEDEDSDW